MTTRFGLLGLGMLGLLGLIERPASAQAIYLTVPAGVPAPGYNTPGLLNFTGTFFPIFNYNTACWIIVPAGTPPAINDPNATFGYIWGNFYNNVENIAFQASLKGAPTFRNYWPYVPDTSPFRRPFPGGSPSPQPTRTYQMYLCNVDSNGIPLLYDKWQCFYTFTVQPTSGYYINLGGGTFTGYGSALLTTSFNGPFFGGPYCN